MGVIMLIMNHPVYLLATPRLLFRQNPRCNRNAPNANYCQSSGGLYVKIHKSKYMTVYSEKK